MSFVSHGALLYLGARKSRKGKRQKGKGISKQREEGGRGKRRGIGGLEEERER